MLNYIHYLLDKVEVCRFITKGHGVLSLKRQLGTGPFAMWIYRMCQPVFIAASCVTFMEQIECLLSQSASAIKTSGISRNVEAGGQLLIFLPRGGCVSRFAHPRGLIAGQSAPIVGFEEKPSDTPQIDKSHLQNERRDSREAAHCIPTPITPEWVA